MVKIDTPQLSAIFYYGTIEDNWLGHIMAEIHKNRIYHPYLPLIKENTVAFDIGAHVGLVSLYFSKYFDKVISLEPSYNHYNALTRNIQSNNAVNIKPINKALYIKEGQYPFGGPADNLTMRSLHMATWVNYKSDEMVETVTIDELFKQEKITKVHLMKLDVEGSEYEILAHQSFISVADKIETIIVERHKWAGRNPQQLVDSLKKTGFKVKKLASDADILIGTKDE